MAPEEAAAENAILGYIEGQQLYLRECDPESHATVVLDNTDLDSPRIVRE